MPFVKQKSERLKEIGIEVIGMQTGAVIPEMKRKGDPRSCGTDGLGVDLLLRRLTRLRCSGVSERRWGA